MKFKIWYGDGTTFDSSQGTWESAPKENVQVVACHPNIYKGKDYYDFDGAKVYKANDTRELPGVSIKYGRWMKNKDDHMKLIKEALLWL